MDWGEPWAGPVAKILVILNLIVSSLGDESLERIRDLPHHHHFHRRGFQVSRGDVSQWLAWLDILLFGFSTERETGYSSSSLQYTYSTIRLNVYLRLKRMSRAWSWSTIILTARQSRVWARRWRGRWLLSNSSNVSLKVVTGAGPGDKWRAIRRCSLSLRNSAIMSPGQETGHNWSSSFI